MFFIFSSISRWIIVHVDASAEFLKISEAVHNSYVRSPCDLKDRCRYRIRLATVCGLFNSNAKFPWNEDDLIISLEL